MFCPKCGQPLVLKHFENGRDELYCVQGDMGLSFVIQRKFEERYGPNPLPQSSNPPFHKQFHGGLHWFCPGDGERLNAQLECAKRGKHLRDLVYQLIEIHHHKNGKIHTHNAIAVFTERRLHLKNGDFSVLTSWVSLSDLKAMHSSRNHHTVGYAGKMSFSLRICRERPFPMNPSR